jgi:hypothetical protein
MIHDCSCRAVEHHDVAKANKHKVETPAVDKAVLPEQPTLSATESPSQGSESSTGVET